MKILALNGGGTAGYASSLYLASLEAELGKPCRAIFDLITGVSTGAIQAIALGSGMRAADLVTLYQDEIPGIFSKPWWAVGRGFLYGSEYKRAKLRAILERHLHGDMGDLGCKVMVYATQIAPELTATFWKNWEFADASEGVIDVALASSAAPGFFGSYEFDGDVYADGALVANNPTMPAIVEAMRLGNPLDQIRVLNLTPSTSQKLKAKTAKGLGSFLSWAKPVAHVMIDAGQDVACYEANRLLGERFVGVDFGYEGEVDSWNPEVTLRMAEAARRAWTRMDGLVTEMLR